MDVRTLLTFFHLSAIVTWVGLWTSAAFTFGPLLRRHLAVPALPAFFADYRRRLIAVSWSAIGVFAITGTILMVTDDAYPGLGRFFTSEWSTLIFTKHLVVLAMLGLTVYLLYSVLPRLNAAYSTGDSAAANRLSGQQRAITITLAGLGLLVLLLISTALGAG